MDIQTLLKLNLMIAIVMYSLFCPIILYYIIYGVL